MAALSAPGGALRASHALAGAALAIVLVAALATAVGLALGVRPHVEASDSMRPALRAGDVVWLDEIPASLARRGDVVAFAHPDDRRPVLHRVERVRRSGDRLAFTTRGDANSAAERWSVGNAETLGRFTGIRVPAVGRTASPTAGLAVAASAVLLLLRRIWR